VNTSYINSDDDTEKKSAVGLLPVVVIETWGKFIIIREEIGHRIVSIWVKFCKNGIFRYGLANKNYVDPEK